MIHILYPFQLLSQIESQIQGHSKELLQNTLFVFYRNNSCQETEQDKPMPKSEYSIPRWKVHKLESL